jgi:tetratricopeptide (TPR) repeat protein
MRPRPALPPLLAVTLAAGLVALAPGGPARAGEPDGASRGGPSSVGARSEATPDDAARERFVRRMLEDARRLERAGRLDAAERTAARGLEADPDHARLHRLRASLLIALGRSDEAAGHRARADALAPAPGPPPTGPRPPGPGGAPAGTGWVLVVLPAEALPPGDATALGADPVAALAERLAGRLPGARVTVLPDEIAVTLPDRARWLETLGRGARASLRVERAHCADTIKDGRFGRAVVRAAHAGRVHRIAQVTDDETLDDGCATRQVARALEAVMDALAMDGPPGPPATDPPADGRRATLALFPDVPAARDAHLADGRRHLAIGDLDAAREAFEAAQRVDPDDLDTRSFLAEVDRTLALSLEIAGPAPEPGASPAEAAHTSDRRRLPPVLDDADRRALERQLAGEQRRRDELLATLALLGAEATPPDPAKLDALRRGRVRDDDVGARRAREVLARGAGAGADADAGPGAAALETRVAYAPDGALLARYYRRAAGGHAVLVEEDTSGDGTPDRWVAWGPGDRREVWETGRGADLPDVHLVYGPDGVLERIDLTSPNRRAPERVFVYRDGVLRADFQDTTGDGRFDDVRHFDEDGSLALHESDADGDGAVDVRIIYRDGRMVRRQIMSEAGP